MLVAAPLAALLASLLPRPAAAQLTTREGVLIDVPGARLVANWDAAYAAPIEQAWRPQRGLFNRPWTLDAPAPETAPLAAQPVDVPSHPGITAAFAFPAATATALPWADAAAVGQSATIELWFAPDSAAIDAPTSHAVLEIGGGPAGVAFLIDAGDLVLVTAIDAGPAGAITSLHRQPLTPGWHQAAVAIDLFAGEVRFAVDGLTVRTVSIPTGLGVRWASDNPTGLGRFAAPAGEPDAFVPGEALPADLFRDASGTQAPFAGRVAVIRYYDFDLRPDEVAANHRALTTGPARTRRADLNADGLADPADIRLYQTLFEWAAP